MADNKAGDVPTDGLSRDRRAQLSTGYTTRRLGAALGLVGLVLLVNGLVGCAAAEPSPAAHVSSGYPWHTDIVATTFWVGEVFDPNASDGSQVISTYDSMWWDHYGGCDGVVVDGECRSRTEARSADNGYFPRQMTPRQNPFYLDLPFDDINNPTAFAQRGSLVPWAHEPGLSGRAGDRSVSFMKNRWVKLKRGDRICYGQIQDAGPGVYDDAAYVFGSDDRRPENSRYNGAGMDVSPALNDCLAFADLDGANDRVDWQFVDDADVPEGPWRILVTTDGVTP